MVISRDRSISTVEITMQRMSCREKDLPEYQVRLGLLPKPRSSMALDTVSIRSKEERIRGIRIAHFRASGLLGQGNIPVFPLDIRNVPQSQGRGVADLIADADAV